MLSSVKLTKKIFITSWGCIIPDGVLSSKGDNNTLMNIPCKKESIEYDLKEYIGAKGFRFHDRSAKLGLVASKVCLIASSLLERYSPEDINVIVGSDGALQSQMNVVFEAIETPQFMNPATYPNRGCNVIAGQVSLMFGFRGESTVISSQYRSGIEALIYAARKIENGAAPYLVLGAEALSEARDIRTNFDSINIHKIEGAVALTVESDKGKIPTNELIGQIIGYKQFVCEQNETWENIAKEFIESFDIPLESVSYVYGKNEILEMYLNSTKYINPYELLGAGILLGLINIFLLEKNNQNILLVSTDDKNNYSLVLLKKHITNRNI